MFNELKTKDDAWMQSIHERIDRLSAMIDGIFGDGAVPPKEDVYLCDSFYALVQAAGIKTVRIKAGRLRAPATDCFLEVREFAVWKKNLFLDFGTKSSPARYQTVIPVCNPFLTVLVTVCFNPA